MAPLIIIAISVAGLVFGEKAGRGQIYQQVEWLLGNKGAGEIQSIIQASSDPNKSTLATILGLITLLIGASGVFGQLKDALNSIWGVQLRPGHTFIRLLKDYVRDFSMVLGVGFLLLISLLLSAALQALNGFLSGYVRMPGFIEPLTELISFSLLVLLFAAIFKVLPDVEIGWEDVWIGAVVTTILFTLGKFLIGLYLGASSIGSGFGAAGALILILVWVYYSTTIFLFGAEFTKTYADQFGSGIHPSPNARFVHELNPKSNKPEERRANLGLDTRDCSSEIRT
jgi:membrane protein